MCLPSSRVVWRSELYSKSSLKFRSPVSRISMTPCGQMAARHPPRPLGYLSPFISSWGNFIDDPHNVLHCMSPKTLASLHDPPDPDELSESHRGISSQFDPPSLHVFRPSCNNVLHNKYLELVSPSVYVCTPTFFRSFRTPSHLLSPVCIHTIETSHLLCVEKM